MEYEGSGPAESLQSTVYRALLPPQAPRQLNLPFSPRGRVQTPKEQPDLVIMTQQQQLQTAQSVCVASTAAQAVDPESSLVVRCMYEFAYTFFLLFASGVAVSDDTSNSNLTQTQLLSISLTVPQFVIGVASHGTLGNSWLSELNFWVKVTSGRELALGVIAQNVGGVTAMLLLWFLRGHNAVCRYQPATQLSMTDSNRSAKIFLVEFVFCLLYGFLFLKLMYRTTSPMRHLAMTAFIYIGIVATAPFSGFGANFVRNIAPGLVCYDTPDGLIPNLAGQFCGYHIALILYRRLYVTRSWC
jgi:glycerol uptake facilitator-like aquaporin